MLQVSFEEKLKAVDEARYQQEMAAMTLPKSGSCEVDAKTTVMDRKYFEGLKEYSCSLPTGTFIGKRWKRNTNAYSFYCINPHPDHLDEHTRNHECVIRKHPAYWLLGEYAKSNKPDEVLILWREIVII